MAYNKQVVWNTPYNSSQFMPMGTYGLVYTKVLLDIPLRRLQRTIWELSDVLISGSQSNSWILFNTSVKYAPNSLKVYADGIEITSRETNRRNKDRFEIKAGTAENKYLYCSYVPGDVANSIGDNSSSLNNIYGIETGLGYMPDIKSLIHLIRKYTTNMCASVNIEPPLWIGGKDNTELGIATSLLPGLTPADIDYHLMPITNKIIELRNYAMSKTIKPITELPAIEFTILYFETIQQILIEIDEVLEATNAG